MTKASTRQDDFVPGRGYDQADWDEVSDNPELTPEQLAEMRPLREVLPDLAAAIDREIAKRGRPSIEHPKESVTLRLDPRTLARFKAKGENWRQLMSQALDEAKP